MDIQKREKQPLRHITLSDGSCMNNTLYVISTDAPISELKMLEEMSCKVYSDGGDEDELPIWQDVLEEKGYSFTYIDEHQHITAYNSSRSWIEEEYPDITEHYVIENQPNLSK